MIKKCNFFKDFIINNKLNNEIQKPKVGDNLWIKYIYVQGTKILRFYSKSFFGRCIQYRRKNSVTAYIQLRNVFNRDPIELSFFLNSPFIVQTIFRRKDRHVKFSKNKLFYLRTQKIAQSKVKR